MEKRRQVIESYHAPINTNTLWLDSNDSVLKKFENGEWIALVDKDNVIKFGYPDDRPLSPADINLILVLDYKIPLYTSFEDFKDFMQKNSEFDDDYTLESLYKYIVKKAEQIFDECIQGKFPTIKTPLLVPSSGYIERFSLGKVLSIHYNNMVELDASDIGSPYITINGNKYIKPMTVYIGVGLRGSLVLNLNLDRTGDKINYYMSLGEQI